MKIYFTIIILTILFACNKSETNQNQYVEITYELQTNDTGFTLLKYGNFYELSNGFSGVLMEDWPVSSTGNFNKTVSIRKGFVADAHGIHSNSSDWSLKIKSANGTALASGVPAFNADSNYYNLRITAPAQ